MSNKMPSWKEWTELTPDQREYRQFQVLTDLAEQSQDQATLCAVHKEECQKDFRRRERRVFGVAFGLGVAGGSGAAKSGSLIAFAKHILGF